MAYSAAFYIQVDGKYLISGSLSPSEKKRITTFSQEGYKFSTGIQVK